MSLNGDHNCKYRLAPSLAPDGTPYTTELGRPVAKFKKYPDDYRLKMYKNLGNSTREGMMLFGYLEYSEGGSIRRVTSPEGGYDLYLRDAVGLFKGIALNEIPADLTSDMSHGDHNSGWGYINILSTPMRMRQLSRLGRNHLLKFIIHLPNANSERTSEDAGSLLNNVRKRNYPVASVPTYLYQPDGPVVLDEKEEWGREFLSESRRRIDLIRFGKFCTGTQDKTPDADNHTIIFLA